jgi:hypothetical protein
MAKKKKGLGDQVEAITKATGIKAVVDKISEVTGVDCGCEKRKEWLNNLPNVLSRKARCLTEQEYNDWQEFTAIKTVRITPTQVKFICDLYAAVFSRPVYYPCVNCSPRPLINMIDKLDIVFEGHKQI